MRLFVALELPHGRPCASDWPGWVPQGMLGARWLPPENYASDPALPRRDCRATGRRSWTARWQHSAASGFTLHISGVGVLEKGRTARKRFGPGSQRNPQLDHLQAKIETAGAARGLRAGAAALQPPCHRWQAPGQRACARRASWRNGCRRTIYCVIDPVDVEHFTLFSSLPGQGRAPSTQPRSNTRLA